MPIGVRTPRRATHHVPPAIWAAGHRLYPSSRGLGSADCFCSSLRIPCLSLALPSLAALVGIGAVIRADGLSSSHSGSVERSGSVWQLAFVLDVRKWLDRHPRLTFHFTPTSSSWLNAVEGLFVKLSKRRLKRGVFRSVREVQAAINRSVACRDGGSQLFPVFLPSPESYQNQGVECMAARSCDRHAPAWPDNRHRIRV